MGWKEQAREQRKEKREERRRERRMWRTNKSSIIIKLEK